MMFTGTNTYPVGVLRTLQAVARALTVRRLEGKRAEIVRREIRREWRYLTTRAKARNWRAIRNSFNGYLCEHDAHRHNCGTGWTKRAAVRRADRICARAIQETPAEWWATRGRDHHATAIDQPDQETPDA